MTKPQKWPNDSTDGTIRVKLPQRAEALVVHNDGVNFWVTTHRDDDDWWWANPNHCDFMNRLLERTPDSWDGEESAEWIVEQYVKELERRVLESGGSLEKYPDDTKG